MSITLHTKNTSVCDLVEKLEHFMFFWLKICKFMQIRLSCGLQKFSETTSMG